MKDPVVLGIVGHEAAKFTEYTERQARRHIGHLITVTNATKVVSGHCHLGGIDIWAIEEAKRLGLEVEEFAPKNLRWDSGYKPRNLLIARASDIVASIVVREYPPGYTGMRFTYCYHCMTANHVKSGGCWTVKQARLLGKEGKIIEI